MFVFTGSFAARDRQDVSELGAEYLRKPSTYGGFLTVAACVGGPAGRSVADLTVTASFAAALVLAYQCLPGFQFIA